MVGNPTDSGTISVQTILSFVHFMSFCFYVCRAIEGRNSDSLGHSCGHILSQVWGTFAIFFFGNKSACLVSFHKYGK